MMDDVDDDARVGWSQINPELSSLGMEMSETDAGKSGRPLSRHFKWPQAIPWFGLVRIWVLELATLARKVGQ